jgi:hypothetical protein
MANHFNNTQNPATDLHPILVTGAHRSGTTWVGKILALNDQVGYISEPLNVWHRPGVMRTPVKHWYTYISKDNDDEYRDAIRETLRFHYHTWREIKSVKSPKDGARLMRDWLSFFHGRMKHQRALLKDPFAVFSTVWFYQQFGCKVIITVRHPAAFVSSLNRLNWSFDFTDIVAQPLLLRDLLFPYEDELFDMIESPGDLIDQGCLLWRIVYSVVSMFQDQYPEIIIIKHEDFAANPIVSFRNLYHSLDLEFSKEIEAAIEKSSSEKNPKQVSVKNRHSIHIDSKASLENWKRRLNNDDICRVRSKTADVADYFYTAEDWE